MRLSSINAASELQGANDPGARAVEMEASRIARRAAELLRQSRTAVQANFLPASSLQHFDNDAGFSLRIFHTLSAAGLRVTCSG